jgi:methylglyoxal synthase
MVHVEQVSPVRHSPGGHPTENELSLTIAIIAHDLKKDALSTWAVRHRDQLAEHRLISTATTGARVLQQCPELKVQTVKSGPLGGDQQIGAMIAEGAIDLLVFFPDPLTPMPHDVDVKALMRLALVYDIPLALNPRTADLMVASSILGMSGGRHTTDASLSRVHDGSVAEPIFR